MKKILGLGNALTDILLQVSEDDLRELGFPKGSMNLISREQAEQIQYRFLSVRKRMHSQELTSMDSLRLHTER